MRERPSELLTILLENRGPTGVAGGVRCLAEEERLALTPEAFGYLLALRHRRQISRRQMERLIHCAGLVSEAPLGRREMDDLLDRVLFDPAGGARGAPRPGDPAREH